MEKRSREEREGLAVCGKPKHLACQGIPAQQELPDCLHLPPDERPNTTENRKYRLGFIQVTAGTRCASDTEFQIFQRRGNGLKGPVSPQPGYPCKAGPLLPRDLIS